jgi:hypothetical protein
MHRNTKEATLHPDSKKIPAARFSGRGKNLDSYSMSAWVDEVTLD